MSTTLARIALAAGLTLGIVGLRESNASAMTMDPAAATAATPVEGIQQAHWRWHWQASASLASVASQALASLPSLAPLLVINDKRLFTRPVAPPSISFHRLVCHLLGDDAARTCIRLCPVADVVRFLNSGSQAG